MGEIICQRSDCFEAVALRVPQGRGVQPRYCQEHRRHRDFDDVRRRAREYYGRNSHKIGERSKLRRYDLTISELEAMRAEQGGLCAACAKVLAHIRNGASRFDSENIDHDHATGQIRGLLCGACNIVLGMVGDDPARLRALANYLESSWEK